MTSGGTVDAANLQPASAAPDSTNMPSAGSGRSAPVDVVLEIAEGLVPLLGHDSGQGNARMAAAMASMSLASSSMSHSASQSLWSASRMKASSLPSSCRRYFQVSAARSTPADSAYFSPVCGQRHMPSPARSSRTPARPTHPIRRAGPRRTARNRPTSRVSAAPAATSAQRPTWQPATTTAPAPSDAPSRTITPRASHPQAA